MIFLQKRAGGGIFSTPQNLLLFFKGFFWQTARFIFGV
jgi:hypothetical protein